MTKIDDFRTQASRTNCTVSNFLQASLNINGDDTENTKNLDGNEHFERMEEFNQI